RRSTPTPHVGSSTRSNKPSRSSPGKPGLVPPRYAVELDWPGLRTHPGATVPLPRLIPRADEPPRRLARPPRPPRHPRQPSGRRDRQLNHVAGCCPANARPGRRSATPPTVNAKETTMTELSQFLIVFDHDRGTLHQDVT